MTEVNVNVADELDINDEDVLDENDRSSHRRCSIKIGVLKNFAKLTGKRLCQRLFFNKVADLRPENTFFIEHLQTTASETNFLYCYMQVITITG